MERPNKRSLLAVRLTEGGVSALEPPIFESWRLRRAKSPRLFPRRPVPLAGCDRRKSATDEPFIPLAGIVAPTSAGGKRDKDRNRREQCRQG